MTIQQLHYVIAVARTGSFSRAAEECYVTQPTLSAQIQKLEVELDCILFDRLKKPVLLTDSGRTVVELASPALALLRKIRASIASRHHRIAGKFRLGIIPTLSQYLVPLFLAEFLRRYPEVSIEIREEISDRIIEDIRAFRIDAGLLALPTESPGLEEIGLFHEEFIGYFPQAYDLVDGGLPETISAAGLRWEDMLLLAEGHCFREQTIDICRRGEQGATSRLEFETGSIESLKRLVEQGLGYTLLPELATLNPDSLDLSRLRRFDPPPPTRHIGILIHPGFAQRDLLEAFSDTLTNALPEKVRRNTGINHVPWRA